MRRLATLATDSGTLQAYLRAIAKFPRLDAAGERDLGERIQRGDEAALTALVGANLRFVVTFARRYRDRGVPYLDLIHEGNWGIIEAARRFQPHRDGSFVRYAVWWVRQTMVQRLAETASAPDRHLPARPAGPPPAAAGGRAWIPAGGGISDELFEALLARTAHEIEDDRTRDALVEELETAMRELDPQERQVIRLRYGLHDDALWTVGEIGAKLRVTRGRVRRLESRAIQKLRRGKHLRSCLN